MQPVVELWSGLCRVRSLRFVAQSAGATGWQGIGTGSVIVDASTDSALTFTESGSWQPTTGRSLRFSNVFRWSRINADLIRLEHLRFGTDHPVYLFDLAPKMSGEWTSVRPHL
ncbi:MAG TPA: hypothetical protein VN688_13000 [Gemmataceae bacterium]|nr:hypothetical protein [Gemmataceae bacterium]